MDPSIGFGKLPDFTTSVNDFDHKRVIDTQFCLSKCGYYLNYSHVTHLESDLRLAKLVEETALSVTKAELSGSSMCQVLHGTVKYSPVPSCGGSVPRRA